MANDMQVTLMWSPAPREVRETTLQLPAGATVRDALVASGWLAEVPEADWDCGIWGRRTPPDTALHDGDRVELYRPLRVDPKVARRERFNRQGARGAGLFASRRPGAKPGY